MEEFLHLLQGEMEKPGIFSWFHLIAFILIIAATILMSYFFHDVKEKTYKRIIFVFWIVLIILEIIKQIVKAFHYGNPSYWEYSIRDFPFSICSMIYYFAPIILFIDKEKHPKIVDAANGYFCIILLAAGLAVCIYTDMVMSNLIYINIQSLIHHGSQVVLGVFIFIYNRRTITIKTYYRSMIAFAITAVMAIIINLCFYPNFINMFFINPTRINNLPVGSLIQEKAGFVVYLLFYLSVVGSVTFLTYFVETFTYKKAKKQ